LCGEIEESKREKNGGKWKILDLKFCSPFEKQLWFSLYTTC
jgi:hypothetical protein